MSKVNLHKRRSNHDNISFTYMYNEMIQLHTFECGSMGFNDISIGFRHSEILDGDEKMKKFTRGQAKQNFEKAKLYQVLSVV